LLVRRWLVRRWLLQRWLLRRWLLRRWLLWRCGAGCSGAAALAAPALRRWLLRRWLLRRCGLLHCRKEKVEGPAVRKRTPPPGTGSHTQDRRECHWSAGEGLDPLRETSGPREVSSLR
jgi:hypothetical protein